MIGSLFDLSDHVVLVTGGTAGIGRGIVEQLLAHGARVAFTSRTLASCEEVARELGDRALGIAADSGDFDAMDAAVDRVLATWGKIDGLVCNAALLGRPGPIAKVTAEEMTESVRVNVFGNLRLAARVAGPMRERRSGAIVFVTSIAANAAMPSSMVYAVAKAGEQHMARNLAAELAPSGVRVNCVAPGLIRSRASRAVWESPDMLGRFEEAIPLGRIGEAEEVGAAVVYLLAPASAYVTGTTLAVDGGRSGIGISGGTNVRRT